MSIKTPPGLKKRKKNFFRLVKTTALAIVFTLALTADGFFLFNRLPTNLARADSVSSIVLKPGQTGRFFVRYGNSSPDTVLESALLNIRLGKSLQLKPETLVQLNPAQTNNLSINQVRSEFNNLDKYRINTNYESEKGFILTSSSSFSSIIRYAPGSANNPTSPSGNLNGVNLNTETFGYVVFEATLRSDILNLNNPNGSGNYKTGDELSPFDQEGVLSFLSSENASNDSIGRYNITIGQVDAQELKPENVNQGYCSPNVQITGSNIDYCAFSLKDNTSNPIISLAQISLPSNLKASVETADGQSQNCKLVEASEINQEGNGIWLKCENLPLKDAQKGERAVNLNFPSGENKPVATVEVVEEISPEKITRNNLSQIICTSNNVLIGQSINFCAIQLIQNGSLVTNPEQVEVPSGITASVKTATGNSNHCSLVSYNQIYENLSLPADSSARQGYWLKCENLPTVNGEIGIQELILRFPDNTTSQNLGFVNLYNRETKNGCSDPQNQCRLYFIGRDNTEVNWNPDLKFNVEGNNGGGWPRNQIFKQGTATIVFDEIKNSDNNYIKDGTECIFRFYRYTQTTTLMTKKTTSQNGKCQVELSVAEQSVNYYRIIATAVDTEKNETMKSIDTLVLAVGSAGPSQGAGIEF